MREPAASLPRRCAPSCAAPFAPTRTRATCTRATRACTRDPLLVAFPRDAADVAAAIAIAGHFDVPVITRGAGTSLAGQTVGAGGLVRDTSRHGRDRGVRHRGTP